MMLLTVDDRKIRYVALIVSLVAGFIVCLPPDGRAEDDLYALNIYSGRMSTNHWIDFFQPNGQIHFEDSYLFAATLAKRVGGWEDKASYEIEGQIVKHFHLQTNWEFNALATVRWEAFWWDDFVDTSVAFGLGPSYATDKPEIEIENDGDTSRFLVYWMLELAAALPSHPRIALIARIHHRSDAYGLVADEGGSNALAVGLKWIF